MSKKRNKSCVVISCELNLLVLSYILLFTPNCRCLEKEAILLKASPTAVKFLHIPYRSLDRRSSIYKHRFKSTKPIPSKGPVIREYLRIEPSDAIDHPKYSQPAVGYLAENIYSDSVPSKATFKDRHVPISAHNPSHSIFQEEIFPLHKVLQNSSPSKDLRFLERGANMNTHLSEGIAESKNNIQDNKLSDSQVEKLNDVSSNIMLLESNVTESVTHLLSSSSDNVLKYENPSISFDTDGYKYIVPSKKSSERAIEDVPSHYSDNNPKSIYLNTNLSTLSSVVPDAITHPPFVLHSHIFNEVVNQTELAGSSETTVVPSIYDVENISSSSISFPSDNSKFSPGTVAGIVIGVLVCATILSSTVIYLLYQKYNGKCTSVVEGKFNSDNCGYLDDSLRSSIYLNNHIELPKESSEEMSSLDNDSFLNSLETMTIQNYWTDSSKNTKV